MAVFKSVTEDKFNLKLHKIFNYSPSREKSDRKIIIQISIRIKIVKFYNSKNPFHTFLLKKENFIQYSPRMHPDLQGHTL